MAVPYRFGGADGGCGCGPATSEGAEIIGTWANNIAVGNYARRIYRQVCEVFRHGRITYSVWHYANEFVFGLYDYRRYLKHWCQTCRGTGIYEGTTCYVCEGEAEVADKLWVKIWYVKIDGDRAASSDGCLSSEDAVQFTVESHLTRDGVDTVLEQQQLGAICAKRRENRGVIFTWAYDPENRWIMFRSDRLCEDCGIELLHKTPHDMYLGTVFFGSGVINPESYTVPRHIGISTYVDWMHTCLQGPIRGCDRSDDGRINSALEDCEKDCLTMNPWMRTGYGQCQVGPPSFEIELSGITRGKRETKYPIPDDVIESLNGTFDARWLGYEQFLGEGYGGEFDDYTIDKRSRITASNSAFILPSFATWSTGALEFGWDFSYVSDDSTYTVRLLRLEREVDDIIIDTSELVGDGETLGSVKAIQKGASNTYELRFADNPMLRYKAEGLTGHVELTFHPDVTISVSGNYHEAEVWQEKLREKFGDTVTVTRTGSSPEDYVLEFSGNDMWEGMEGVIVFDDGESGVIYERQMLSIFKILHPPIQTILIDNSVVGGTFTLTFEGQTTPPLEYNASANVVRDALQSLSNIPSYSVDVTGKTRRGSIKYAIHATVDGTKYNRYLRVFVFATIRSQHMGPALSLHSQYMGFALDVEGFPYDVYGRAWRQEIGFSDNIALLDNVELPYWPPQCDKDGEGFSNDYIDWSNARCRITAHLPLE